MYKIMGVLLGGILIGGIVGCGQPKGPSGGGSESAESSPSEGSPSTKLSLEQELLAQTQDPASAVRFFLDAVRRGDDQRTEAMFTPLARERVDQLGVQVAPPGSDTAQFQVGKVEMVSSDSARVESQWTDLDENGQSRTDQITWTVRREKGGWRVSGMAASVFEGEPPVLLDFENPKETLQKLEAIREELRRRQGVAQRESSSPEESAKTFQK